MRKVLLGVVFLLITVSAFSQRFSSEEINQSYANRAERLIFIFDSEKYNVNPNRVVVTGIFRGWSDNMNNSLWQLQKSPEDDLWTLEIDNSENKIVSPGSAFKFRIDQGKWMDPPSSASNAEGGNLIYMKDNNVPTLKAEIINQEKIWLKITGIEEVSLDPEDYILKDWTGKRINVHKILPNTASKFLLITEEPFNKKRIHTIEIPEHKLKAPCDFDGWFRELYSSKPLGAEISEGGSHTSFRIFAPRAEAMKLYLYNEPEDEKAFAIHDLTEDENGIWEIILPGNLKGTYYDFTVHGPSEPGSFFYEREGTHISDPYARVNMDAWGRSRVWSKTIPAKPLKNGIPKMEDVVAYEVHVQDFTDQLPISDDLKGTISGMIQPGLKNSKGQPVGFDYLLNLGINVVHLMPVQEYLHFKDDLWKKSFQNDPYMIEQGVSEENYQWGYRTTHCFAIESKYRQKGTEPGSERDQFRDLVQAFHENDMAVIIDIVPNHTGENMDDGHHNFHWNALDMLYYYRTKDFEHIGAFGNEVKTEDRPMVQRWLIDQCKHFIEEFGIDGFRIDLAGQIDKQSLKALRKELGPDIIIYGEPWIGSNDPNFENNPDWDWYKEDSPITFFQDDTRNAFKGPVFDIFSKQFDRGWPGGKYNERENVVRGLSAAFPTDKTPLSGINYLDIHDNWALADQFATRKFDGRFGVDEDRYKMAATLLHTSLGPIVLHGGSEIMRSKGSAPLREVVKTMVDGQKLAFHGKRDTYNMRTANNFVWENVGKKNGEGASACDYVGMHKYWQGLIKFRLSEYGKVFRISESPLPGYFRWMLPEDEKAIGYIVDEKVLVLINSAEYEFIYYVNSLHDGEWKLIANNEAVDHVNGVEDEADMMTLYGGNVTLKLPPESIRIWVLD